MSDQPSKEGQEGATTGRGLPDAAAGLDVPRALDAPLDAPERAPPPGRELRLCLIMYGGVSLAVYMNGVAREYFDLVRGRGVWGVFKRLADVDVVVDVISGASAGGLNGLFLAYALCGQREFGTMVDLWRRRAGIEALLGDPAAREPHSLLKSEYMEAELASAFETMPPVTPGRLDELAVSASPDLDCFMAATNFYGKRQEVGDPAGSPIPTKSHRATVHFKHRLGRKEPFGAPAPAPAGRAGGAPAPAPAPDKGTLSSRVLAKVARATSAFPAAFRPIELTGDDLHGRFATDDMDLAPGQAAWYIDGGVLDNKPFTCALPMIYQRHADRPVDRMLFFVEPDPDADQEIGAAEIRAAEPNFLETALASLSSLPSYESILGEIRSIDGHNRKIELFDAVFGHSEGLERKEPLPAQWEVYSRARVHRMMDAIADELSHPQVVALQLEVVGVAGDDGTGDVPASVRFFRQLFATRFGGVDTAQLTLTDPVDADGDRGGAKPGPTPFDSLDVDFVKRAFYYWIYRLYDQLAARPGDDDLRRKISFLSDRIDMLLFLDAQTDLAVDALGPAVSFAAIVRALSDALSGPPALVAAMDGRQDDTRLLSERRRSGGAATTRFVEAYRLMAPAGRVPLLPAFLALLDRLVGGDATATFRRMDAWRFPAVYAAGLGELDRVEYFRVSPLEAAAAPGGAPELARFRADPMRRLAGRHLAHFGAFLNKAWRSNDVMWGRVDSASVLWDVLLRRRGYSLSRERAGALLADLDARGWPGASERELRDLRGLVADFAAGRSDQARFTADLLACHQRAILADGVPDVIADAAGQVHVVDGAPLDTPVSADAAASSAAGETSAAQEMLAAFEAKVSDPLLRSAAEQAVRALLGGKPESVLGYVASRYEVGAAGLPELDRQQVSVTALQAGRVVTNMFKAVLPRDGLARSLQGVLAPLSTALKSAHLLSLSVREGIFPVLWLALLLAATATAATGVLFLHGSAGWQVMVASALVLAGLLLAPGVWFAQGLVLRWARWPILVALPSGVAAGVFWLRHRPSGPAMDAHTLTTSMRGLEIVFGIVLLAAAAAVALYASRIRGHLRVARDTTAAQGRATAASAAIVRSTAISMAAVETPTESFAAQPEASASPSSGVSSLNG